MESIAYHRYKLDLAYVWPAFWLAVPDLVRSEITAAGSRFADATVRGAWAVLYSALAVLWPPACAFALVLGFAAWRRGRAAAAAQTQLLEAAIDLHGRRLADGFGMTVWDRTGPLSEDEGAEITRICRKGR